MAITLIDKTIMNQQVCIWSLAVKYVHLFASWEILHGKALTTVFSHNITCSYLTKNVRLLKPATKSRNFLAWENSRHFATPPLVSPRNDVSETSAEIPYWCRTTTQIWVVFLIGRAAWEIYTTQIWRVISMEFLRSFLRRHLAGKPVVASPNVGCFLRLLKLAVSGNLSKFKQ